jgi:hypothetical protein
MEELKSADASTAINRADLARRGQRLEYCTIAWNSLEGLAALITGSLAGSIALVGFGLDSLIEVVSGVALLWRLHHDADEQKRTAAERIALRIVGSCCVFQPKLNPGNEVFYQKMDVHKMLEELRGEREQIEEAIMALQRLALGSGKRRGASPSLDENNYLRDKAEAWKAARQQEQTQDQRGFRPRLSAGDAWACFGPDCRLKTLSTTRFCSLPLYLGYATNGRMDKSDPVNLAQ